jgi:hypothetical protein
MNPARVHTLKHAQLDAAWQVPPRRDQVEVPRLPRLVDDPAWCGDRVRLTFRGEWRDFYLAGSMATALAVTRDSLLRLEARGVVPPAQFFVPGRWPGEKGRARCYPRGQVLRSRQWLVEAGLLGRRLSYRREEVRAALQAIADEEAAALRVPLPAVSA